MLANAAIVEAVAAAIDELELPLVVVDPVMVAKSGDRCSTRTACARCGTELLPLARVVTPNLPEAEVLSGAASARWTMRARRRGASRAAGARAVVIKGGHFDGRTTSSTAVRRARVPRDSCTARIDTRHTHGTGCTFAAVAGRAARAAADRSPDAVQRRDRSTSAGAIAHAPGIGHGHGPLDHFWR